ncbi:MAG TPA: class I SAM-dependent methyltransferase [Gemmatimonadaceae bacterium]|nr:class I SAM-dependent methyltransferase [Gemmatimonadaceae bacterium]
MRSKLSPRLAAGLFLSIFGAGACDRSASRANGAEEAKALTSQEAPAVTQTELAPQAVGQAQPAPSAKGTNPVPTVSVGKITPVAKPSAKAGGYTPTVGQAGKDVVWVPTPQPLVDRMLDMADLTRNDIHFDLGSGDGRTVITAAKRGARSTGVEYNPDMVALSRRLAQQEGVGGSARFIEGDIFKTDFSNATVVTLFLLSDLNLRLRPTLLDMKPGTRVVSNTFNMGDWKPDETQTVNETAGCSAYCTAHLWIVPAKVAGRWTLPEGELVLTQTFQQVAGTLGATRAEGTLRGNEIIFVAGNARYTGQVNGNTLTGRVTNGSSTKSFTATRAGS